MPTRGPQLLTIVVPVFDEEAVIALFAARARAALDGMLEPYELIFVDDGSRDGTPALLSDMAAAWPQARVLTLRRNAGHQAAITAGLDHARGEAVITMDADLQDPPEVVPELVEAWRRGGVDVVYAVRDDRSADSRFKRWTAGVYYRGIRRLAGSSALADAADFRLMSRPVIEALATLPERHKVYRLLVPWLGFPSAVLRYPRAARAAGSTKYPLSKMTLLAFDSVTSFSARPLRVATWAGVLGSLLCFLAVGGAIAAQLSGHTVPGWASVIVAVFFIGAVQLLCLGLLGEYVGRLFAEAQRRPLYDVATDSATRGSAPEPDSQNNEAAATPADPS